MSKDKRLVAGSFAPQFEAQAMDGKQFINLQSYSGKHLLLSFYRYASCPLCNLRVHDVSQLAPLWQARGLQILGVFQSPAGKMQQYVGTQQPSFPLIADPAQRLYALYGIEHSWGGVLKACGKRLPEIGRSVLGNAFLPGTVEGGLHRIPADFLIDAAGKIVDAYYGNDIGDHMPVARIEQYVREIV